MSQRPPDAPDNANETCVGPANEAAGKTATCEGCPNQQACASGAGRSLDPALGLVSDRMAIVKHKILVLSGKGGVGKSTVAAQLAFALAAKGKSVGLLDIDICGPSIPRMLGLLGQEVHQSAAGWSPVYVNDNLGVMSIGFMLPSSDDAVIWRGPRKNGIIKQFLTDVDWGELDYLIVDTPPGTSDEHLSVVQYLRASSLDGAVVVTTPQEIAMMDVRKELNFCLKCGIPVLGVLENMGTLRIPLAALVFTDQDGVDMSESIKLQIESKMPELMNCFVETPIFPAFEGGPQAMAEKFGVPYLGSLPMDTNLFRSCEEGVSFCDTFPTSPAKAAFEDFVNAVIASTPDARLTN